MLLANITNRASNNGTSSGSIGYNPDDYSESIYNNAVAVTTRFLDGMKYNLTRQNSTNSPDPGSVFTVVATGGYATPVCRLLDFHNYSSMCNDLALSQAPF